MSEATEALIHAAYLNGRADALLDRRAQDIQAAEELAAAYLATFEPSEAEREIFEAQEIEMHYQNSEGMVDEFYRG